MSPLSAYFFKFIIKVLGGDVGGVDMRKLAKGKRKGKIVGQVRKPRVAWKDNLWILQLLDDPSLAADLNYSADDLVARASGVA